MSRSFNQVILMGNLTRDPELRATSGSGVSICRFGLALNREYTSPTDNQKVEETTFVDIVVWGKLAEVVNQYCRKGKQVLVSGRLTSSSWEQDGQKRSKVEVTAQSVIFTQGSGGGAPPPPIDPAADSRVPASEAPEAIDDKIETDKINIDDVPF